VNNGGRDAPDVPDLDAAAIVAVLNQHGVNYVVIGAFAAIAQQAPIPATRDIDITPESTRENLERLSAALHELHARVRTATVPGGLPFDHDGASLRDAAVWNLICTFGEFDISFRPAAFEQGFAQLIERAHQVRVGDTDVLVADIDDVILSKETAGRPKDLLVLPTLYQHRANRSVPNSDQSPKHPSARAKVADARASREGPALAGRGYGGRRRIWRT
jgi:hypothetical protein